MQGAVSLITACQASQTAVSYITMHGGIDSEHIYAGMFPAQWFSSDPLLAKARD